MHYLVILLHFKASFCSNTGLLLLNISFEDHEASSVVSPRTCRSHQARRALQAEQRHCSGHEEDGRAEQEAEYAAGTTIRPRKSGLGPRQHRRDYLAEYGVVVPHSTIVRGPGGVLLGVYRRVRGHVSGGHRSQREGGAVSGKSAMPRHNLG